VYHLHPAPVSAFWTHIGQKILSGAADPPLKGLARQRPMFLQIAEGRQTFDLVEYFSQ
jgi:hypothetical protein